MNRKWLLGIILVITVITIGWILLFHSGTRYNRLIIEDSKWNKIITDRKESTNIILENIEFNDYKLLINTKDSALYYSVSNTEEKYNPLITYSGIDYTQTVKQKVNKNSWFQQKDAPFFLWKHTFSSLCAHICHNFF